MLICLTGAHSTGKSTLMYMLQKTYPIFKSYQISDSDITRELRDRGFKINEDGDNSTQILIMAKHVENSCRQNALLGRCALDGLVYTRYLYEHGKVEEWVCEYALNVCKMLLPKYSYIFYLEPEFVMTPDGVRSIAPEFQESIVRLFKEVLIELSVGVVKVSGTLGQRMSQIVAAVVRG